MNTTGAESVGRFAARWRAAVAGLAVLGVVVLTGACAGGGSDGDGGQPPPSPAEVKALANDDPNDPLIVRLVNERDGYLAGLFGSKDGQGMPLALDTLELWAPGMDADAPGYAMLLDEMGRPSVVTSPFGEVIHFTYQQHTMALEVDPPDAPIYTVTLPLPAGVPPGAERLAARGERAASPSTVGPLATTTRTIVGKVTVVVSRDGKITRPAPLGTEVTPSVTNGDASSAAWFEPASLAHEFRVTHRLADVQTTKETCRTVTTGIADLATVAAAVIGAASAEVLAPLTVIKIGLVMMGVSLSPHVLNPVCDAAVEWRANANAEGGGRVKVDVTVRLPGIHGTQKRSAVEYALFDPSDPVMRRGEFATTIVVYDCGGALDELHAAEARLGEDPEDHLAACQAANLRRDLASNGCLSSADTAPQTVEQYGQAAADFVAQHCGSGILPGDLEGCWELLITAPAAPKPWNGARFVLQLDGRSHLERGWRQSTLPGTWLEGARFTVPNAPFFEELIATRSESVTIQDAWFSVQYAVAGYGYSLNAVSGVCEIDRGRVETEETTFADLAFDSTASAAFHGRWQGDVRITEGGEPRLIESYAGTVSAVGTTCPPSGARSQEEQGDACWEQRQSSP